MPQKYLPDLPSVIQFLQDLLSRGGSLSSIHHVVYHADMKRPDEYRIYWEEPRYTLPKES